MGHNKEFTPHNNYTITTIKGNIDNTSSSNGYNKKNSNSSSKLTNTPEEIENTPEFIIQNNIKNGLNSGVTPEEIGKTPEDLKYYEGNWNLQIPTAYCLRFFMTHPEFTADKQFIFEKIAYHLFDLPKDEIEAEVLSRMENWGKVLNMRFDGESPKRNMRGRDSWVQLFRNWVVKQPLQDNPKKIIDNQSVKSSVLKSSGGSQIGKIQTNRSSEDEQVEFYKRKQK